MGLKLSNRPDDETPHPTQPTQPPFLLLPQQPISSQVLDQFRAAAFAKDWAAFDRLLLHSGSDSQFHIHNLNPLMFEAVRQDSAEVVAKLLSYGMPVSFTLMQEAVRAKAKDSLVVLIETAWDINKPLSSVEPTLLGYAMEDREMAICLIDHGADLNKQTFIDLTPMSYAIQNATPELIEELLDRGGDVQKGELLQHALDRAEDTIEVLGMLIDRGAPLNKNMYEHHDGSWRMFFFMNLGTPLHKAASTGKIDEVRYLLGRNADVTIKDVKGRTALECAEKEGFTEVVEILKSASET